MWIICAGPGDGEGGERGRERDRAQQREGAPNHVSFILSSLLSAYEKEQLKPGNRQYLTIKRLEKSKNDSKGKLQE